MSHLSSLYGTVRKAVEEVLRPAPETSVTGEINLVVTARIKQEPIRILHLSDLHVSADTDPYTLLQPLVADLEDDKQGFGLERLDYLVISGDLTNRASAEEFELAYQFISMLLERFKLNPLRTVIIPGNHDLSWDREVYEWKSKRKIDPSGLKAGNYVEQGEGYLIRDDGKYHLRFENFSKFYHSLIQQPYPLKAPDQCLSFLFDETGVQFISMNSSWEIDEYFKERAGINSGALARGLAKADEEIRRAKDDKRIAKDAEVLRIAVWHHPVTGNEKIFNDAFMEQLRAAKVKLCLHGHVHEERPDVVFYHRPPMIHIAGAGSFGAVAAHRPESTPRLYNLIEIARDHSRIEVYTRSMRKDEGAWEGWAV